MSKMFEKFKSEKNWQIIGKLIELIYKWEGHLFKLVILYVRYKPGFLHPWWIIHFNFDNYFKFAILDWDNQTTVP